MFGNNQEQLTVDLYIRVSTEKQATQGDSLEEQESELKKYCEFRNFKIHRIYIEKGRSAKNTDRPEYQKMMEDIKAKKIDAIVIKKLDRLSRSLLDFEQLLLELQTHEVGFISLKEQFDTSNPMGQAMIKITMVFAELERKQISERVSDTMTYRATQGLYNGGVCPYGYTSLEKEMVPYKKERNILHIIYDKFLELESTAKVARFLNDIDIKYRNNRLWDKRRIHDILKNPTYKGMIRWKGHFYPGLHQPLISESKYEKVQAIFKKRNRKTQHGQSNALLQKILFCPDCEAAMSPCFAYNRQKIKYYYYRCTSANSAEKGRSTCKIKYISREKMDDTIKALLLGLSKDIKFIHIESPVRKLNLENESKLIKAREETHLLEKKLELLTTKKDKYFDTLLSAEFNSAERKNINRRIDEMQQEETKLKHSVLKLEYEQNQYQEELVDCTQLKQLFISFKADYETFSENDIKDFIQTHIKKIAAFENHIWIQFSMIPIPIIFPVTEFGIK